MKIARIYTEAKNVMWIRNTVTVAFSGATFFEGLGLWEGQFEQSLVIELHWTNPNDRIWKTNIELLAHKIATHKPLFETF